VTLGTDEKREADPKSSRKNLSMISTQSVPVGAFFEPVRSFNQSDVEEASTNASKKLKIKKMFLTAGSF
jgi:hypothetical protein